MPELPEVETVVVGLKKALHGQTLLEPEVWRPDIIESGARAFQKETAGRRVHDVARRGKWILVHLDSGRTVLAHLRMTGRFAVVDADLPRGPHDHVQWRLAGTGTALRFTDIRRFGRFRMLETSNVESYLQHRGFGPEPLDVDVEEFSRRLGQGKRPIKSALLDQRVVAGIGNIYADEILFAARIDPRTPVAKLGKVRRLRMHECMKTVLASAIQAEGTSLVNFVTVEGRKGAFAAQLSVFRRTGLPCPVCGKIVARVRLSGRATHFCRHCQR